MPLPRQYYYCCCCCFMSGETALNLGWMGKVYDHNRGLISPALMPQAQLTDRELAAQPASVLSPSLTTHCTGKRMRSWVKTISTGFIIEKRIKPGKCQGFWQFPYRVIFKKKLSIQNDERGYSSGCTCLSDKNSQNPNSPVSRPCLPLTPLQTPSI